MPLSSSPNHLSVWLTVAVMVVVRKKNNPRYGGLVLWVSWCLLCGSHLKIPGYRFIYKLNQFYMSWAFNDDCINGSVETTGRKYLPTKIMANHKWKVEFKQNCCKNLEYWCNVHLWNIAIWDNLWIIFPKAPVCIISIWHGCRAEEE